MMLPDEPQDLDFELWCGERLGVFPDPPLWRAIQEAKREFQHGRTILIRRTQLEGSKIHVEIFIDRKQSPI